MSLISQPRLSHSASITSSLQAVSGRSASSLPVHFGKAVNTNQHDQLSLSPSLVASKTNDTKQASAYPKLTYQKIGTHHDRVVGDIHIFQFSNGMKLYALQRHEVPLVSYGELYKIGSANEQDWNNGVSHFLEHLIFKGTEKIGPKDFAKHMENTGGAVNAWTGSDATFYHITNMPKEALANAIKIRAEVVQNALVPQKELDRERGAVLEEINASDNQKMEKLSDKLFSSIWSGTPYQRTILGPKENIKNLTRDEILDYYGKHYGPQNRNIIAVGDFNMNELLDSVASHYNHPFPPQGKNFPSIMGKNDFSKREQPISPAESKLETIIEDPDVKVAMNLQGVDGPRPHQAKGHREILALDLLAGILGGGASSRLYQDLVEKQKLATDIGANMDSRKKRSAFIISSQVEPENLDQVRKAIAQHLEKVKSEPVTQAELDKVLTSTESGLAKLSESSASLAESLAFIIGDKDLKHSFSKELDIARTITPKEILETAQKYLLTDKFRSFTLMPPKVKFGQRMAEGQPYTNQQAIRFSGKLGPLDHAVQLPGGTELLVRPKPNALRTAISVLVKDGRAEEGLPSIGKSNYLAAWLLRGTKTRSATELQKELEQKGISLKIYADTSDIMLKISGLKKDTAHMVAILTDVLNNPAFRQEDLDFIKKQTRENHQAMLDLNPSGSLSELLLETRYPSGHPYGVSSGRLVKNADKMTPDSLQKLYQSLFRKPNMTMAMAGGITVEDARLAGEKILGGLSDKPIPLKPQTPFAIAKDQTVTLAKNELPQAEIMQKWKAPATKDSDRAATAIMSHILSSFSGRLHTRFRESEDKALSYFAYTHYSPDLANGDLTFHVGTEPKNITRVQKAWDEERKRIMTELPSEEEVDRAKKQFKSAYLATAESTNFASDNLATHRSFDLDAIPETLKKLDAVTGKDVREAAKACFSQPSIKAVMASADDLKKHHFPVIGAPGPKDTISTF